jgi:hypothetical protein
VLDEYAVAPYDDAELYRLRAFGVTDIEDDASVLLAPEVLADPEGNEFCLVR